MRKDFPPCAAVSQSVRAPEACSDSNYNAASHIKPRLPTYNSENRESRTVGLGTNIIAEDAVAHGGNRPSLCFDRDIYYHNCYPIIRSPYYMTPGYGHS